MFCFSSSRYEAMITVVKPSTRILSVMYYAREPGKIKYALFPFKSIIFVSAILRLGLGSNPSLEPLVKVDALAVSVAPKPHFDLASPRFLTFAPCRLCQHNNLTSLDGSHLR